MEFLEEDISVFSHTILDGFCVTFMLVAFTLCCFWFEKEKALLNEKNGNQARRRCAKYVP